jgi:cystathionine gamma-synthase
LKAISVSLPTWGANVGYEEGEEWVLSKMKTGYPRYDVRRSKSESRLTSPLRFFIHKSIQRFADAIVGKYGRPGEKAMLFPSRRVAQRCVDFFRKQAPTLEPGKIRIVELLPKEQQSSSCGADVVIPRICAVLFPTEQFSIAKAFWQHSGDGTSSRRAAYCHQLFDEGLLVEKEETEDSPVLTKGPRRYRNSVSGRPTSPYSGPAPQQSVEFGSGEETNGQDQYVEERFGRNLNAALADKAKLAIRRRIAGSLVADVELKEALESEGDGSTERQASGISEDDVYLFPTGMSAIFNAHQAMLTARGDMKSVCYG